MEKIIEKEEKVVATKFHWVRMFQQNLFVY